MPTQKAGQVLQTITVSRVRAKEKYPDLRASLRHMPDVNDRNAISVGFLALNADAVATGSRGAQNGLVIRSEDQSVGGRVSEVLSECSCLVNVAIRAGEE